LTAEFLKKMERGGTPNHRFSEAWPSTAHVPEFASLVAKNMGGRMLSITEKGFLGVLPNDAKEGDLIAIFTAGGRPFVLRQLGGGEFTLVGVCYIHGISLGEIMDESTEKIRDNRVAAVDITLVEAGSASGRVLKESDRIS
jgi:hypothetical protein